MHTEDTDISLSDNQTFLCVALAWNTDTSTHTYHIAAPPTYVAQTRLSWGRASQSGTRHTRPFWRGSRTCTHGERISKQMGQINLSGRHRAWVSTQPTATHSPTLTPVTAVIWFLRGLGGQQLSSSELDKESKVRQQQPGLSTDLYGNHSTRTARPHRSSRYTPDSQWGHGGRRRGLPREIREPYLPHTGYQGGHIRMAHDPRPPRSMQAFRPAELRCHAWLVHAGGQDTGFGWPCTLCSNQSNETHHPGKHGMPRLKKTSGAGKRGWQALLL